MQWEDMALWNHFQHCYNYWSPIEPREGAIVGRQGMAKPFRSSYNRQKVGIWAFRTFLCLPLNIEVMNKGVCRNNFGRWPGVFIRIIGVLTQQAAALCFIALNSLQHFVYAEPCKIYLPRSNNVRVIYILFGARLILPVLPPDCWFQASWPAILAHCCSLNVSELPYVHISHRNISVNSEFGVGSSASIVFPCRHPHNHETRKPHLWRPIMAVNILLHVLEATPIGKGAVVEFSWFALVL